MELGRRFDLRILWWVFCGLLALIYIAVGLNPAEATEYLISDKLKIPAIDLEADVAPLTLNNHKLDTPDTIVGSYSRASNKTLLIGHSTSVFHDLNRVKLGDNFEYDEKTYAIVDIETLPKTEIKMDQILAEANTDTVIIMTCAGELLDGGDATHRLIVTATRE